MKAKLASFLLFLGFATEVVEGFSRSCRSSSVRPAAQLLHYVTKLSRLNPLLISASPQEDTDFLNAEQQPPNNNGGGNNSIDEDEAKAVDSIRQGLRRLAQLSLEDYDWRMSVFKEKEANRKVEEYMAGILGEDPDYVRPMDASEGKIGPLVSRSVCGKMTCEIDADFNMVFICYAYKTRGERKKQMSCGCHK